MADEAVEIRAILRAYREVMTASWPHLHPGIDARSARWDGNDAAELRAELDGYLRDASEPGCRVRIFWKLGRELKFGGFNRLFALDAGMAPETLLGMDDYDKRLPWFAQAAKYRADDEEVFNSGRAKLDILERQRSSGGIIWVRAGKAPIRTAPSQVIGILGMYEVLDSSEGQKLFSERSNRTPPS